MSVSRLVTSSTVAVAAVAALLGTTSTAQAAQAPPGQAKDGHVSFAVVGDVPYGDAQIAAFPAWIDQINAAAPALTFHVGDIKNGSSRCDDAYYSLIRSDFDRFVNPLVYTPGDNEWTDCHRANNGGYNPLERLAHDRSVFFDTPGTSLGQNPTRVDSQAAAGFPENVQLRRDGVDFAVLHVVGSNDGRAAVDRHRQDHRHPGAARRGAGPDGQRRSPSCATPSRRPASATTAPSWCCSRRTCSTPPTRRTSPPTSRRSSRWCRPWSTRPPPSTARSTWSTATATSTTATAPSPAGSSWLTTYGVTGSADNLERITVDGSGNNKDWLKVTVNRPGAEHVLSWERIPYTP